jgi:hypothetical protein
MSNFSSAQTRSDPLQAPLVKAPSLLRLMFSSAADHARIIDVFRPEIKSEFDPNGFVKTRPSYHLQRAVEEGNVALVEDQDGDIQALSIAYHHDGAIPFNEIGSVMSRLRGWNLGKYTVAAQVMREKFSSAHAGPVIAKVSLANATMLKFFDTLRWERVHDAARIHAMQPGTVQDLKIWFEAAEAADHAHVSLLQPVVSHGTISNRDGQTAKIEYNTP